MSLRQKWIRKIIFTHFWCGLSYYPFPEIINSWLENAVFDACAWRVSMDEVAQQNDASCRCSLKIKNDENLTEDILNICNLDWQLNDFVCRCREVTRIIQNGRFYAHGVIEMPLYISFFGVSQERAKQNKVSTLFMWQMRPDELWHII